VPGQRWGLDLKLVTTADVNDNTPAFADRTVLLVPDGGNASGGITATGQANLRNWIAHGRLWWRRARISASLTRTKHRRWLVTVRMAEAGEGMGVATMMGIGRIEDDPPSCSPRSGKSSPMWNVSAGQQKHTVHCGRLTYRCWTRAVPAECGCEKLDSATGR
jgi:hypothetical protein